MKPDPDTRIALYRRTDGRIPLPVLLLLFLVCLGSAVWFASMFQDGLRRSEAQLLSQMDTVPAAADTATVKPFITSAPLAGVLLGISSHWTVPPEGVRAVPVIAGIVAVLLLYLTARYSACGPAPLICLVLTFSCTLWLTASHSFGYLSCSLAGVVCAQYGYTAFDARPSWRRMAVYIGCIVIGILLTPLAFFLLTCHALLLLYRTVRISLSRDTRQSLAVYVPVTLLCILVPAAAAVMAHPRLQASAIITALKLYPAAAMNVVVTIAAGPAAIGTQLQPVLPVMLALSFMAAVISCMVNRSRAGLAWIAAALFPLFLMLAVMQADAPYDTAAGLVLAWPFCILLCAEGCGFIVSRLLNVAGRRASGPGRIILYTVIIIVCLAGMFAWFRGQDSAYRQVRMHRAPADLSLPVVFLREILSTGEVLYVASADALAVLPETRYYLAPYLDGHCPAQVRRQQSFSWQSAIHRALSETATVFYAVGPELRQPSRNMAGWSSLYFPYAVPVGMAQRPAGIVRGESYRFLQDAIARYPHNTVLRTPLFGWYSGALPQEILTNMYAGTAQRDLSAAGITTAQEKPLQEAVNRVFMTWDRCLTRPDRSSYDIFDQFIRSVDGVPLNTSLVSKIYAAYAKKALAQKNYTWGTAVINSALQTVPGSVPLYRLAAQIELMHEPPHHREAIAYNNQARQVYRTQNNKPYFDAWFANILIERETKHYRFLVRKFREMREAVQKEYMRTVARISNAPPRSASTYIQWRERCLFWEGQCNSYIAHTLLENGQYLEAQEWITRNLDERFNPQFRKVAGDRLFELYEKSNDIMGLYKVLDTLISNAMSTPIRLNWMIEKAHRQVTYEDPVGAYESLQHIYAALVKLPAKERRDWSADPRYQRVYRHIESQMKIDIRDTVIPVLLKRAQADTKNGGWYYTQAGQLYRCRLKYGKAEETFRDGIRKYPECVDNYLDGGLLQYQLKRYPKADKLFTNLTTHVQDSVKEYATDWRFRVLAELRAYRRPAVLDDVLAWGAKNRALFASDAHYRNYTGNVYALFGEYERATNEFFMGISRQDLFLDNYLDAGYLLCIRGNSSAAGKMLDSINTLTLDKNVTERLDTDWRYIELHHVSGRPYILKE